MAGISFHFSIIILTTNLVFQSSCLDIYRPEHTQAVSDYDYTPYFQAKSQTHQPNPYDYRAYYQSQALREPYQYQLAAYQHALTPQNLAHVGRRSSQSPFQQSLCALKQQQSNPYRCCRSIPPIPTNFPGYPSCDIHNYPTVHDNQDAKSIPMQGRDSRSAIKSLETQTSDDVAAHVPMMMPMYLSHSPINLNDANYNRAAQAPPTTFYDRPMKNKNYTVIKPKIPIGNVDINKPIQSAITTSKTKIFNPLKFYKNPNMTPKSDGSQARDTVIDNSAEDYSDHNDDAFSKINSTKNLGNVHPSESNEGKIYYSKNISEHPKLIESQMPSGDLSKVSAVSPDNIMQSPATNTQQPTLNYGTAIGNKSYNPYDYFKSRTSDSSPLISVSSVANNSRPYPIYTPNISRDLSMKYPQL